MARLPRVVVVAALATITLLGPGQAAYAADEAAITHVQHEAGAVSLLVSVPPDSDIDLSSAEVTIDGAAADATAKRAAGSTTVRRTSVLAIDTSNSMRGARFAAAKAAALVYLDTLPADVYVGIVTFDSDVSTPLSPTLDRDAARGVIDKLSLRPKTRLYDGVLAGVEMAGTEGQRSLLVLSDGADTSRTEISAVQSAISDAEVLTDVVSLEQAGDAVEPLSLMAAAGDGQVISADSGALADTFSAEADVLARQVLVTANVPASVTATDATVAVSLQAGATTLTAEIFAPVRERTAKPATTPLPSPPGTDSAIQIPLWGVYTGVGLVGIGLLGFISMLVLSLGRPAELTAAERVVQYAAAGGRGPTPAERKQAEQPLAQAKGAAAGVLSRNKSLEQRIARRLDAAGSGFLPSEWLLLHAGIVVGAGLLGLLVGRGNIVLGLVFLLLGVLVPWVWLGMMKKRRYKAFNAALPDTLQLISGSLAAGLSLAQSIDTIVREGGEPVATEFRRVLVETRLGVNIDDALEGVAERFDSKDFSWVVMAIRIQRQVGGNLAELLDTVAGTIREREYLRRQVLSLSAEGRLSAWVLGLLPPLFMVYLLLTQPDYFGVMFTSPLGWLMMGGAAVALAVGAFWMSRLVKVEV
ncbi:type II secretion system F family protein [Nocardioides sp. LHG3406-4]|uniref:type II secretion system F family protein n=1 Tax=Nocardioides sp. LHG3406-4 TaxID=2804575 RepID=UPI003CF6BD9C